MRIRRSPYACVSAGSILAIGILSPVAALGDGFIPNSGPDIITGDCAGTQTWTSSRGIAAYSFGSTMCNAGDAPIEVLEGTGRSPINGQQLYRYKVINGAGRFEQIGMSWVRHFFCELQTNTCGFGCTPACGGCCDHLGIGCSSNTTAIRSGSSVVLGPRAQVKASVGSFFVPHATPTGDNPGRLHVNANDVDPSQNAGAAYYAEILFLAPDDGASGNGENGASYRRTNPPGVAPNHAIVGFNGSTVREQPAIYAWQAIDPNVNIQVIDIPNDGRMIFGFRFTDLSGSGEGPWDYEYALYNLNSHRGARSFTLTGENACYDFSNVGFHDVSYHSGDGDVIGVNYDGTDWTSSFSSGELSWSTADEATDPNANALRWGTLYNFRLVAETPPSIGTATISLYRAGDPAAMVVSAAIPSAAVLHCLKADVNLDGTVDGLDITAFSAILVGGIATDLERCAADLELIFDCQVDLDDVQPFVDCLLNAGCP